MGTRWKLIEVKNFIKNLLSDKDSIDRKDKIKCWSIIVINLFKIVCNAISSPFIYPMWYLFRNQITSSVYKGTSWEEIQNLMDTNQTEIVKQKLKSNGNLLYWIWTYGDSEDPLVRGGLPESYGPNTFWYRFKYSAIRNPRFNDAYINFRTSEITEVVVVIDNSNFNFMHKSYGIGDSPDGIYFKWMKDNNGKWYFIYEDNNKDNLFYFGYTGLLRQDVGNSGGRFETGYRITDSSYIIEINK